MQTETQWQLKSAELLVQQVQKKLPAAESHQLQAAIEIIKGVAQRVNDKK